MGAAVLGAAASIIAGFTLGPLLLERWHLHRLETGSEEERRAAAGELGRVRSLRAVPILFRLLAEWDAENTPDRRPEVGGHWISRAILEIGAPAVPFLRGVVGEAGRSYRERILALLAIGKIGPARDAVPELIGAIEARDDGVKLFALHYVGEFGPDAQGAVPLLVRRLHAVRKGLEKEPARRGESAGQAGAYLAGKARNLINALGRIGPAALEAVPVIALFAADESPELRVAAASALATIEPDGATTISALERLAGDGDANVRAAVQAIAAVRATGAR